MTPPLRKRVLIDASPLTNTIDGLAVYIVNLIKHLPAASPPEVDYTVLLNPGVHWPDLAAAIAAGGMAELRAPIAPIGPRRDLHMARFLRAQRGRFDLVHITSNNYPFALKGGICTVHDVTFKRWFDRRRGIPGTAALARFYLDKVIRHALARADAVIAVSAATRAQLIADFCPRDPGKIAVIHEGWEHLDTEDGEPCAPFAFEDHGYLFFLGSYRVHKNLARLLRAFRQTEGLIPASKRLVISGSSGRLSDGLRAMIADINRNGERVVFTGYVSNACVRRLYEHADGFIFPSLSEGFGLPVLEAFRYGAPVLAANTTALPEVAGDAALYFDPASDEAIAAAIVRFYREPELADTLRRAGAERLKAFSWAKAAAETVALYRRLLELR